MIQLSQLKNVDGAKKGFRRVGRGPGCKRGKTCGRGHKGDKSRSGYKSRYGKEGGQLPLYRKLPCRGFSNGRFKKESFALTLGRIESLFNEGDKVNVETLRQKRVIPREIPGGLRIIGTGELKKKVVIEAHYFSKGAAQKLSAASIEFKTL